MIRFSLSCTTDHGFEGWFASSEAFEAQRAEGLVACPVCGASDVDKALMAPAVATARKKEGKDGEGRRRIRARRPTWSRCCASCAST